MRYRISKKGLWVHGFGASGLLVQRLGLYLGTAILRSIVAKVALYKGDDSGNIYVYIVY